MNSNFVLTEHAIEEWSWKIFFFINHFFHQPFFSSRILYNNTIFQNPHSGFINYIIINYIIINHFHSQSFSSSSRWDNCDLVEFIELAKQYWENISKKSSSSSSSDSSFLIEIVYEFLMLNIIYIVELWYWSFWAILRRDWSISILWLFFCVKSVVSFSSDLASFPKHP